MNDAAGTGGTTAHEHGTASGGSAGGSDFAGASASGAEGGVASWESAGGAGGENGESGSGAGGCGPLAFSRRPIDDAFTGENKALGDVDGDGLIDILVGGPWLKWYEAPDYVAHDVLGSEGYLTSHMQVGDVNADGALDVVTPDAYSVYWFENPLGSGGTLDDAWPRHLVGDNGELVHELAVADLDLDGKLDIVTNPGLKVWIQDADPASFIQVDLASFSSTQGLAVGDIDDDGRPDIAVRGQWVKTPADAKNLAAYLAFPISDDIYLSSSIQIADLDENGTQDVAYAPMESGIGELLWFSASSPTATWQQHVVGEVGYVHDFVVADIDAEGRPDIVFAEMNPSPTRRVGFFANRGDDQWQLEVIASTGSHNIVVGDLGNDCDLDIAGSNWEAPPVEIWEHQSCTPCSQ